MTELEKELQSTVKMQKKLFKEELSSITKEYMQNLEDMKRKYNKVISDQQTIIQKQDQTLKSYAEASKSITFKLDDQQIQALQTQVRALEEHVESLQRPLAAQNQSYQDLAEAFNQLQNGLKSLEEKL